MYRFKTGYTVADAMTRNPILILPDKNLRDAAKLMTKEHVGSLLVRDKDDKTKIIGIVTEQDIIRKGISAKGNPATKKMREIMETDLHTTSPDEDIFEALRVMRDYNIRHLPVMHDGAFVGFVTLKDILKIEPDLYEILVEKIELREMERKPVRKQI